MIEFRKSNKFATGVEDEATCVLKLNVGPGNGGGGGEMDEEFMSLYPFHLTSEQKSQVWILGD